MWQLDGKYIFDISRHIVILSSKMIQGPFWSIHLLWKISLIFPDILFFWAQFSLRYYIAWLRLWSFRPKSLHEVDVWSPIDSRPVIFSSNLLFKVFKDSAQFHKIKGFKNNHDRKVIFELKINSYMPGNIKDIFSIVNKWIKMDLIVFWQHKTLQL